MIAPKYEMQRIFKGNFGYKCNLKNPITINEKLQCLKFGQYNHNQVITQCVDKYRIREYLKKKNMEELCPKLYGVFKSPEEIEWNMLPESFVLKCNHGCGYNILIPDKKMADEQECKQQLRTWMKEEFWKLFIEIQYKYVDKRIIAEEYLGDDLRTYKFYCFNGEPKIVYVSSRGEDGEQDKYINYYSTDWEELPYMLAGHIRKEQTIEAPQNLEELVEYARRLSQEFPFVRVDLYSVDGRVYISELTFIPTGGYMHLMPEGTDVEWGNWLRL